MKTLQPWHNFSDMPKNDFSVRLHNQLRINPEGSPIIVAKSIVNNKPSIDDLKYWRSYIEKSLWVLETSHFTINTEEFDKTYETLTNALTAIDTEGIYDE